MRSPLLILERFDAPSTPPGFDDADSEADTRLEQARAEGYVEGFAAGEAAAAANGEESDRLLSALAAALEAEAATAPDRLAREAGEALKIILEKIFPSLAREGFAVEAAAAIAKLAGKRDGLAIEVATAPEEAPALEALIAKFAPDAEIAVKADDAIAGPAARAVWANGGMDFDLDRAADECLAAFRNAVETLKNGDCS